MDASSTNNKSALALDTVMKVEAQICDEIRSGTYVCDADKPKIVRPLGATPRKNHPTKYGNT